jgi:hypothetical protein
LIPASYIQEWSSKVPWPDSRQVEQDLIITRALCDLFNSPALAGKIALRGGTAINKLLFQQPLRYSEDIDLVQTQPEPIGATVDAIRDVLSWLGIRFNDDDAMDAFGNVWRELIARIKGDPWKLSGQVIDELRRGSRPNLLR